MLVLATTRGCFSYSWHIPKGSAMHPTLFKVSNNISIERFLISYHFNCYGMFWVFTLAMCIGIVLVWFHQIQFQGYDAKSWNILSMGWQIAVTSHFICHIIGLIFQDFVSYPEIWIWWNWTQVLAWLTRSPSWIWETAHHNAPPIIKGECLCCTHPCSFSEVATETFSICMMHFRSESSLTLLFFI